MAQITIGRNAQSTIVVDAQYNTVSGNHATISYDGAAYILQDHSTNGTYVNGNRIHHTSCQIRLGDHITLGTQYVLNMNEVISLLGGGRATQRRVDTPATARVAPQAQPMNQQINVNIGGNHFKEEKSKPVKEGEPSIVNKWNWGAFLLGWIWAIGNGVWWGLIGLIPYAGFIVNIILGATGNRSAWEKYEGSATSFEEKQRTWTKAGLIIFIISMISVAALTASILSY